ncbi:HD domain-containing protein [Flavobacterium panacagri]|uniref:HD domain-containing protein n=1 Tax=Flavobacterium panacagri TaxID=3034146 RepID=UPI0025A5F10A|nr:HD domain-containing protein [Flavobacterium panacagri]
MIYNYRDNYYGSILDPLHGDIKLSEIEKWIIKHPIFTRLRKVKQNTFLYYVFPSANHTRFEHSIGVMHLAGKIFDSCKENFATGQKKKEKYSIKGQSSFYNLNNLEDREEFFYQELRLAALLHDIGHGPLSHLFDKFAISKDAFLKIVEDSTVLKNYYLGFEKLIAANKNKVEHEIISCAFIFILIDELKTKHITDEHKFSPSAKIVIESLSAERIVKLIEPDFENLDEFIDSKENNYTSFFSRIITSFPIDADRMDYLLRDSYFSGVTYGIYDINRIFASFMASKDAHDNVYLAYKESGLDSMLRFIQSRTHLYNQVYFHKTNRSANTMLAYASASSKTLGTKLLNKSKTIQELMDFYIKNSDEVFLNDTAKTDVTIRDSEKEVLEELLERKLFKRVYQAKIILTKDNFDDFDKIEKIKEAINEKLKPFVTEDIFATTDIYENKTFKDSDIKCIIIAQKSKGSYQFNAQWENVSKEFSLMNMNVVMVRIYLRRTFTSSNDFERKKKTILDSVSSELSELEKYANT